MAGAAPSFAGPQYYNDCMGPVLFEPFAADLSQRLPPRPPGDVLEIACGTGLLTKRLRERLAPSSTLVATDISAPMLDYARAKLAGSDGIEWRQADAMTLPFGDGRFGAVVCGFGFMFMPDRQAALKEARRMLVKGGILLFNVWDRIERNPHALANAAVLERLFPGQPEMWFRTPYEMHDVDLLHRLLEGAAFVAKCIEAKRVAIADADPRSIATGQIRGTPRSALIEQRGIALDAVIEQVAAALIQAGGNPYHGQAQAVIVEARAI